MVDRTPHFEISAVQRHSSPAIILHTSNNNEPPRNTIFKPERIPLQNIRRETPNISTPSPIARPSHIRTTEKELPPIKPWAHLSPLVKNNPHDFDRTQRRSWRWSRFTNSPTPDHQPNSERKASRWSQLGRRFSRQGIPPQDRDPADRRASRLSTFSRLSRPLSFNGSIWVKNPDDIVIGFNFVESFAEAEGPYDPTHHVFSRAKKKRLVYLVSLAAMFSPLSSNIYFPALDTISLVSILQELAPSRRSFELTECFS
jgi:hypothetical protein